MLKIAIKRKKGAFT